MTVVRFALLFTIGLAAFAFHCHAAPPADSNNSAPEVAITAPTEKSVFRWNAVVPFSISVSDAEDGKTEFEEIPANKVFLHIAYLPDDSQKEKYLGELAKADNEPLRRMGASNCFTCHTATTKLIGPSFDLIAKRYTPTPETVDALAKKILAGTAGTWGPVAMPPHPDLKIEEARQLVDWILKNNTDPNRSFVIGYEGAFRTREKPEADPANGIYVLTATYKDRGAKDAQQTSRETQHTVVLKSAR